MNDRSSPLQHPATAPAAPSSPNPSASQMPLWLIVLSGCTIVGLAMGVRNIMGLYMPPVTKELGVGRELFSLAMAIANIVWGLGAPIAGAISDKYGTARVVVGGALTTMTGLYLMYAAGSGTELLISGLLMGLGISGTGVTTLIGAVGQRAPAEKRMGAMAAVSIGSGIGILCALPYTHLLIQMLGWRASLIALMVTIALMFPLAYVFRGRPASQAGPTPGSDQTLTQALSEAFRHPSYGFLTAGYFVCGFHVTFYSVHLPAFVADKGLAPEVAAMALMAVGIFNIIGTYLFSWLAGRTGKRVSLSLLYGLRSVAFLGFLFVPITPVSLIVLSAMLGLLWLATVPLTTAMVGTFFGTRWLAMLSGIVFLSHQVGAFIGVWAAGYLFDLTRSYDIMWWISCALGLFAALAHLPIKERPVARLAPQPA